MTELRPSRCGRHLSDAGRHARRTRPRAPRILTRWLPKLITSRSQHAPDLWSYGDSNPRPLACHIWSVSGITSLRWHCSFRGTGQGGMLAEVVVVKMVVSRWLKRYRSLHVSVRSKCEFKPSRSDVGLHQFCPWAVSKLHSVLGNIGDKSKNVRCTTLSCVVTYQANHRIGVPHGVTAALQFSAGHPVALGTLGMCMCCHDTACLACRLIEGRVSVDAFGCKPVPISVCTVRLGPAWRSVPAPL